MARPLKVGFDYFPHDCDASSDEKIEYLRTLHKNDGYTFYFILLERIYRTDSGKLFLDDITKKILSKKIGISFNKFSKILKDCVKISLFDRDEFEKKSFLTSQGIQKRFVEIQAERTRKREFYHKEKRVLDGETTGENSGETTGEMGGETTQSKVKQSINNKFEIFWKMFNEDLGKKGSKQRALQQFTKLNLSNGLFDKVTHSLVLQIEFKQSLKSKGEFFESFPHVFRWIKDKRWEDEITKTKNVLELN